MGMLSYAQITFQNHIKIILLQYTAVPCIKFINWGAYLCTHSNAFPQTHQLPYFLVLHKKVLITLHIELYANFLHLHCIKLKLKYIILINPTYVMYDSVPLHSN